MRHPRLAAGALALSAAGLVGLISHEGYTERAIVPVPGDRPTVGFGSTFRDDGSPVRMGDTITPPQAVARTLAHVQKDETRLRRCVTAPISQVEYDLLVDHAYQYGAAETCSSGIVRMTNARRYADACEGYLAWRFMTSSVARAGWEPFRFDAAGRPVRWRYDCTTPGNRICSGVGKRSTERADKCRAAQQ